MKRLKENINKSFLSGGNNRPYRWLTVLSNVNGNISLGDVARIATIAAVVIAMVSVIFAKCSFDKASDSFKVTKETLEVTQEGLKLTEQSLEITRQAFDLELLKSRPKFHYELKAKIHEDRDIQDDIEATVKLEEGTYIHDVDIIIEAGLTESKNPMLVYNFPKEFMTVGESLTFDKTNQDFISRINRNIDAMHPQVFKGKKLNLLKLYAKYRIKLPHEDIPFNDDEIGIGLRVVPEYH